GVSDSPNGNMAVPLMPTDVTLYASVGVRLGVPATLPIAGTGVDRVRATGPSPSPREPWHEAQLSVKICRPTAVSSGADGSSSAAALPRAASNDARYCSRAAGGRFCFTAPISSWSAALAAGASRPSNRPATSLAFSRNPATSAYSSAEISWPRLSTASPYSETATDTMLANLLAAVSWDLMVAGVSHSEARAQRHPTRRVQFISDKNYRVTLVPLLRTCPAARPLQTGVAPGRRRAPSMVRQILYTKQYAATAARTPPVPSTNGAAGTALGARQKPITISARPALASHHCTAATLRLCNGCPVKRGIT